MLWEAATKKAMKSREKVQLANEREKERLDEVQKAVDMSLAKVPGDEKLYISG